MTGRCCPAETFEGGHCRASDDIPQRRTRRARPPHRLGRLPAGQPLVPVFAYDVELPGGGMPGLQLIAEDAFEAFNADPEMLTGRKLELATRYRQALLRSPSFPGKSLCCPRSCCPHPSAVWPWIDLETEVQAEAVSRYEQLRNGSAGQETRR